MIIKKNQFYIGHLNMKLKKKKIFFIYGNTPNPSLIERALAAEDSGKYESYIVYWSRKDSDISIPFSKLLPNNRFIEIALGDPRGNIIRRITLSILFSLKLRKKISFINPDIIYPVNPDMLGLSFLSNLFLRKKKLVYDFQDQKGEDLNFIYKSLYKISALNVSTVFIRSEGFIDHIRSNNLFKKNVIIKYFAEAPLGWELFEKKYTNNNFINPLVVGYFGNIRGKKEIESLIDAVKTVNDEGKNIKVKFAGVGSESNLVDEASKKFEFIEYLGPFDYFENYKKLFISADIIYAVYPTNLSNYKFHEARRFHESIAAGIPIIVSDGTYMAKRVKDLNVGWAVNSNLTKDIQNILLEILQKPDILKSKTSSNSLRKKHRMEFYINDLLDSFTS